MSNKTVRIEHEINSGTTVNDLAQGEIPSDIILYSENSSFWLTFVGNIIDWFHFCERFGCKFVVYISGYSFYLRTCVKFSKAAHAC